MKRDFDHIRELLLEFESRENFLIYVNDTDMKRGYDVGLMCDVKLMKKEKPSGIAYRLVNQGHDFINVISN
ncbi:MAG: hypothetical protein OXC82_09535 [Rhodobacteraceae bacterium]|nr:hypothetical protein [Paracoccaceae bacterium]MCY4250657.1 hypothetical protein [Paracoccaceae bacterium]MCY4309000.1 hypothetical protein [Paracoccaceae bacterium]